MDVKKRRGFIYDAAVIDTVVGLKELRVGDQVILQSVRPKSRSQHSFQLPLEMEGKVCTVYATPETDPFKLKFTVAGVVDDQGENWLIERREIAAWRRPKRRRK